MATAPHGAAALDVVAVHAPALILLDLRMPIMDGWSFVQHYRRITESPADIVLMSAANDLPSIASQLRADGHLNKPLDLRALRACVATHVDRRPTGPRIDTPPADRASSSPLS